MSSVDLNLVRFGLVIVFLSVSVILNSLGIYCLRRTKHKVRASAAKQHQIISCLSISELCYSFLALGKWILNYQGLNRENSLVYRAFYASVFSSFYVYCCLLLVLLTNRLLFVVCPIRHLEMLSKKRVRYAVIYSWMFSYSLAIPLIFLNTKLWSQYISLAYVVIEILVLISSVTTFSFIGCKVQRRNDPESKSKERQQKKAGVRGQKPDAVSRRQLKLLTVALLTIFSFLPLVVIPDFVVMILLRFNSISDTAIDFIYSMLNLNFVIDPLVYMITYPLVRRQLNRTFRKMKDTSIDSKDSEFPPRGNQLDKNKSQKCISKEIKASV